MQSFLLSRPRAIASMFGPKVVEEFDSKFSGHIRVLQGWGYKYVSTGYWTQSGGVIKDLWEPVLKKLAKDYKLIANSWLILGLATGTVAKIISDKYSPAKITGVEIDPIMIAIGKKYFDLDAIPNLKTIQGDAQKLFNWKTEKLGNYDFILVDLYCADQIPKFVYSPKFLGNLRNLGNLIIINHLFHTDPQKKSALSLQENLKKIFSVVTPVRSLTNLLLVCQ